MGRLCGQRGPPDSWAPQLSHPQNAVFFLINRRVPRKCIRLCPCGRGSQSGCCPFLGTSRQVSAVAPGGLTREDRPRVGCAGARVCMRAWKLPEPHGRRLGLGASAGWVGPARPFSRWTLGRKHREQDGGWAMLSLRGQALRHGHRAPTPTSDSAAPRYLAGHPAYGAPGTHSPSVPRPPCAALRPSLGVLPPGGPPPADPRPPVPLQILSPSEENP